MAHFLDVFFTLTIIYVCFRIDTVVFNYTILLLLKHKTIEKNISDLCAAHEALLETFTQSCNYEKKKKIKIYRTVLLIKKNCQRFPAKFYICLQTGIAR